MNGLKQNGLVGHVLVVDDNLRARQSMADVLRAAGHEVLACASAMEALKQLDRNFDVVITDLQMPGMNGLEFIRALEERKVEAQVVMVTAFASVSSAVEAMRHGAFDYIEKKDAVRLSTYPDNFKLTFPSNPPFWAENVTKWTEICLGGLSG